MGAALAYYTLFSIAPLLLIVISVAGLVFGADAARGADLRAAARPDGRRRRAAVAGAAEERRASRPQGVVGTVVGVVLLLVGATTVFGELQNALDRIWRAPARAGGAACGALVRARLLSFGMILGIGFLLIVSLVASAGVAALGTLVGAAGSAAGTCSSQRSTSSSASRSSR